MTEIQFLEKNKVIIDFGEQIGVVEYRKPAIKNAKDFITYEMAFDIE